MSHRTCAAFLLVSMSVVTGVYAQQATIVGTVEDESGLVLPGVTVTAVDPSTGLTLVAVTDGSGLYRVQSVPPGTYNLTAVLPGFATVVLTDVELLVGQNATLDFTMGLATVQETVTVTGEAPLIDFQQADVSGNVDRRQMDMIPISGRNWMELTMLVKGVTNNTVGNTPGIDQLSRFQLNLDGQEITQQTSVTSFGQPGMSRDAIAEYEVITDMFDVTQGRSAGLQVNAITKSGTNDTSGTFYGYFRDDRFNAADPFTGDVLPYENQQLGGTIGGPIVQDRAHYFFSYEREREPGTTVVSPNALAGQIMSFSTPIERDSLMGRTDFQLSSRNRLSVRANYYRQNRPNDLFGSTSSHPSRMSKRPTWSAFGQANWTHVTEGNLLHELKVGYYQFWWVWEPVVPAPEYRFPGLTVGAPWNYYEEIRHGKSPFRYDLSWVNGGHAWKVGVEYLHGRDWGEWRARERGQYFFTELPHDIADRVPLELWNQPERWDFSGLDSIVERFDRTFAEDYFYDVARPMFATWLGDNWTVSDRLTLNYGVRYDLAWGDLAPAGVQETELVIDNGLFTENVGYRNNIRDLNNVAPRFSAAFDPTGEGNVVIRGGTGLFYATVGGNPAFDQQLWNAQKVIFNSYPNDGLSGFIDDPQRGATFDDIISGRVPLAPQSVNVIAHDAQMPYVWQSNVGFQVQLNEVMAFDSDLIYNEGRFEETQSDPNVFYDEATGFNLPPARFGRPRPDFGPIRLISTRGKSDYLALANSFTRRYRDNFQLGATYTVMFFKHDTDLGSSGYGSSLQNHFNVDDNWGRANDFQKQTLRLNGIWTLPHDISIAGFYRFGSGEYTSTSSGYRPTGIGNRIRADYSLIPRNEFALDPFQSFDLRITKDFVLPNDVRISGVFEVFNTFNTAFYDYNTLERSSRFRERRASGREHQPRTLQLAFRVAF